MNFSRLAVGSKSEELSQHHVRIARNEVLAQTGDFASGRRNSPRERHR